jgi:hypothetical protein
MKRRAVWVTIAAVGLLAPGAFAQAGNQPGQQPTKQQPDKQQPDKQQPDKQQPGKPLPAKPGQSMQQPGQMGQQQPGQMGQQQGQGSGIAEAATLDENEWRALTTEPFESIEQARTDFGKKRYVTASGHLRNAAVWLKLASGHFAGDAKNELLKAVQVLNELSDGVMPGDQQRSTKDVDQQLAFVSYQLARFHANEAASRWSSRDNDGAGLFLKMAALEADKGLRYGDKKPDSDGKKAIKNGEDIGNELLKGGEVTPDKVDKALDDVKGQLDKLAAVVQPIADKQQAVNIAPTLDARDWMAFHGELTDELKAVKSDFNKNGHADAVQNMFVASALLKLEGNHAGDRAKTATADAANELVQQARNIKDGTVKRAGDLDATFAKTQLAMAFAHNDLAKKLWGERNTMEAGGELGAAADALGESIGYKTIDVPKDTKKVIDDTKKLAAEMVSGKAFDAAAVDQQLEAFGKQLGRVGSAPLKNNKQAQKARQQAQR